MRADPAEVHFLSAPETPAADLPGWPFCVTLKQTVTELPEPAASRGKNERGASAGQLQRLDATVWVPLPFREQKTVSSRWDC